MTADPEGRATVTPWLVVPDTAALLEFLIAVFRAVELVRILDDAGAVSHAEARIGNTVVTMFDRKPQWSLAPQFLRVDIDDTAAVYTKALGAGARSITEPTALAFGELVARFADPWDNIWSVHQRLEKVTAETMAGRWQDPAYARNLRYTRESLHRELDSGATQSPFD
ncbi:VOC family protein [Nocardia yamanashiensis]|uniref:VOC family protein n=1 Tax=Nocardia yamanashiensis TaxID=209247 RepID=UPI001E589614|nr:VOC family protein [Nocardia yamanashiensis]UGT44314.1 VOC family protein [Nocardia yamanashiensis]